MKCVHAYVYVCEYGRFVYVCVCLRVCTVCVRACVHPCMYLFLQQSFKCVVLVVYTYFFSSQS